jgi:hypothetical protein
MNWRIIGCGSVADASRDLDSSTPSGDTGICTCSTLTPAGFRCSPTLAEVLTYCTSSMKRGTPQPPNISTSLMLSTTNCLSCMYTCHTPCSGRGLLDIQGREAETESNRQQRYLTIVFMGNIAEDSLSQPHLRINHSQRQILVHTRRSSLNR